MVDEPGAPRPDVLAERIANLTATVTRMDERMSGLATSDMIATLIKAGDELLHSRVETLSEDIKDITAALAAERAERHAADLKGEEKSSQQVEALKSDIKTSRTLALTSIGLVLTLMLGVVGLIVQVGGLG